jgi:hypothetical protein
MVFIMLGLSDVCANVIAMSEDKTEVLSVTESIITPYGSFTSCVMNKDYSGILYFKQNVIFLEANNDENTIG